jgi:[acyl-carrier-protein] S-malonyltransferase
VSVAAAQVLAQAGHRPTAVAGHSLGEYSALVVAGSLSFADAVQAVHQRGRFMQEAVPEGEGAMAAIIGLDVAAVADLCREAAGDEIVVPANLNAPGQVVIAGQRGAVDRAVAGAKARGARRALFLNVSAPFHSPLMEPAARRLEKVLAELTFADAQVPVWTNVDAAPVTAGAALRQALVRQVAAPVRWEETVRAMGQEGILRYLEVGPGTVLAGLVRRILPEAGVEPAGTAAALQKLGEPAP